MILFPTFLIFDLVYFKIYLNIFPNHFFCTVFEIGVICIFLKIGFLGEKEAFKNFGEHPHLSTP